MIIELAEPLAGWCGSGGSLRHSTMRYRISILGLCALTLWSCACTLAADAPEAGHFMDWYGSVSEAGYGWAVSVSSKDGVHIGRGGVTVSPTGWKAHDGWFVYTQSEQHVWVFDGERELLVVEATPKKWQITRAPCSLPVPEPVLARLPRSVRESVSHE